MTDYSRRQHNDQEKSGLDTSFGNVKGRRREESEVGNKARGGSMSMIASEMHRTREQRVISHWPKIEVAGTNSSRMPSVYCDESKS